MCNEKGRREEAKDDGNAPLSSSRTLICVLWKADPILHLSSEAHLVVGPPQVLAECHEVLEALDVIGVLGMDLLV